MQGGGRRSEIPVHVSFDLDSSRLVCTLTDGSLSATATASVASDAAASLLAALQDARDDGVGECFWHEQGGDYRWMFCRREDRVDVALMWCAGVITGWQHVFRTECGMDTLMTDVQCGLERLARASA
jgi:hypothetical protein